jgi:hypothetical protein
MPYFRDLEKSDAGPVIDPVGALVRDPSRRERDATG